MQPRGETAAVDQARPQLLRKLRTVDLALITIGAVIGSGIFRTPAVVAQRAHWPVVIIGCWLLGGVIALAGGLVFAELAARRPVGGGLYGYLRDAYHPVVAFLFGWTLLLISGTGANAAAAVLFAGYLGALLGGASLDTHIVAVVTLFALAGINLLGVRQGGNWQNLIAVLKVGALVVLIGACFLAHPHAAATLAPLTFTQPATLLGAIGVAMLPVLFTYAGFQGTTYVTSEAVRPDRSIPRALLIGIGVVVVVYVLANVSYLRTLGPIELAASKVPAAEAMRAVLGDAGSKFIALAIALSTLGYLSTCMLILPRVYHQMAADGRFFKAVAWVSPKTRVPAIAILLQAVISSAYAFSGTYEQIVNWVIAPMWLFIVIGASAVFVFRRRDAALGVAAPRIRSHPVVAAGFIAVLVAIFTSEFLIYPRDTLYGSIVVVSGVAAYYIRQYAMAWRAARPVASTNEP